MYGQRRWTVPASPSICLISMTICKIVSEICVFVSPRSYAVPYPAASASAVHRKFAVTPVHTCSDLSVLLLLLFLLLLLLLLLS